MAVEEASTTTPDKNNDAISGGAGGGKTPSSRKTTTVTTTATPLVPSIHLLVDLWHKLSQHCLNIIRTEGIVKGESVSALSASATAATVSSSTAASAASSSQAAPTGSSKTKQVKEHQAKDAQDRSRRKSRSGGVRPPAESSCELCTGVFPVPVTQHMRQAHPGCQKPALGLGYNPDGHYCGGWVGNCGEGGIQGSSWYLLCEACRHRYLQQRKQVADAVSSVSRSSADDKAKRLRRKAAAGAVSQQPVDTQATLKDNALFLLQLSSAALSDKDVSLAKKKNLMQQHQQTSSLNDGPPQRKVSAPPMHTVFIAIYYWIFISFVLYFCALIDFYILVRRRDCRVYRVRLEVRFLGCSSSVCLF